MDQSLRNKLRGVVTQSRKLLEEAVAQVLQGQFGIYATGKKDEVAVEDAAGLGDLSADDRAVREQILVHLKHVQATGFAPQDKPTAPALVQMVREVAFTHLNRLCAYKMMEARGLIREAVSRGLKSNGFLHYLGSGGHEAEYRLYSRSTAFTPAGSSSPPTGTSSNGWAGRSRKRSACGSRPTTPRTACSRRSECWRTCWSRSTTGRIWYEMRKGDTALKDRCRYMVRRPNEVFLSDGEAAPAETPLTDDGVARPIHIPHRAKKDPRELKILDPACGSGHFLLYCFDLLLVIYLEAYDDPDFGPAIKQDYPTPKEFKLAIPGLILSRNLHGIDIDLRASQIAALALWLRAQRAYIKFGILKANHPKVVRSNFVCAEPMPGEEDEFKDFVNGLDGPRIQSVLVSIQGVTGNVMHGVTDDIVQIIHRLILCVWNGMRLAGGAGTLL